MGERKDFTPIARRVQNAAYELAIAFHEAEDEGCPARLREVLRTAAIKASHVAARFNALTPTEGSGS